VVIDQEDDREEDGQRTSLTGPAYKSTRQSGSRRTGTDGIMLCSPPTLLEDGTRRRRLILNFRLQNFCNYGYAQSSLAFGAPTNLDWTLSTATSLKLLHSLVKLLYTSTVCYMLRDQHSLTTVCTYFSVILGSSCFSGRGLAAGLTSDTYDDLTSSIVIRSE